MFCKTNRSCCPVTLIIVIAAALVLLKPAEWLVNKPANSNATYAQGWSDACRSAANATSPVAAFLEKPFVQQPPEEVPDGSGKKPGSISSAEAYKNGWNEGFTLCRFYQSTFQGWGAFFLLIATLFVIRCRCSKTLN